MGYGIYLGSEAKNHVLSKPEAAGYLMSRIDKNSWILHCENSEHIPPKSMDLLIHLRVCEKCVSPSVNAI